MNQAETEAFTLRVRSMPRGEVMDLLYQNLHDTAFLLIAHHGHLREKQLLGGVFGHGGFVLASLWEVVDRLDSVYFYVFDKDSRYVIGSGSTKAGAISDAREFLLEADPVRLQAAFARFKRAADDKRQQDQEAREMAREEWMKAHARTSADKVKSISRRRKRIFDEADGKCHYCGTALTLDGKWHIEHKMPKALGGGDEPGNLVASCVPCNHEKIDTTDIEYKAKRAARGQA